MIAIKKYGLLAAGVILIVGALIVAATALPAVAQGMRGNGNNTGTGDGNGNGTGMMGGSTGGMMGNGSGSMMNGGMMGGTPGSNTGTGTNQMMGDIDRHFIEQMIPHHQAAIAMADLALQKAQRPEIKTLAASIKQTQSAEIDQMRAWYKQWYGTDVPTTGASTIGSGMMGGSTGGMMGNAGGGMGGMMGECSGMGADLSDLQNAADFDKAFIEAMIPHHEMALMMTTMEQSLGQKSDLRTLSQSMYSAQSAEIEQMRTWYQQWYGTSAPTN